MNMHADDPGNRYRQQFDRACGGLDAATATRLRGARVRALQAWRPHLVTRALIPAGALAAALLAVGVAWQRATQAARVLSLLLGLAFVGSFAALLRLWLRDWRIVALAAFMLAYSGGFMMEARISLS